MRQVKQKFPTWRILFLLLGLFLTANALVATLLSNFHTGIFLTWLLSFVFLLPGIFYHRILKSVPRWICRLWILLPTLPLLAGTMLFTYGSFDTVTYNEDVLIVLGAGLREETPGKTLTERLDRAVTYHKKNPHALILVSGGQGPGETITEALAMERYLVEAGVPVERILKEEAATSTGENLKFAKDILDKRLRDSYSVCLLTNDYHIYRARYLASAIGLENATGYHAPTPLYTIIPSALRECLAVVKSWIFKI